MKTYVTRQKQSDPPNHRMEKINNKNTLTRNIHFGLLHDQEKILP